MTTSCPVGKYTARGVWLCPQQITDCATTPSACAIACGSFNTLLARGCGSSSK